MSKPANASASFRTDRPYGLPTKGRSILQSATDGTDVINAPSRPNSKAPMRLPLTPTKATSPRKLRQRSEDGSPTVAKAIDKHPIRLLADKVEFSMPQSAERLARADRSADSEANPLSKLTRRSSHHRLRKDGGTAGHSRSLSLSRVPAQTFLGQPSQIQQASKASTNPEDANWLEKDPAIPIAAPLVDETQSHSQGPTTPQRKPSFYRRRNTTFAATEEAGDPTSSAETFPMPSPVTEIVRSMHGAIPPLTKSQSHTGLLHGLARKLSHHNLRDPLVVQPKPLPADFDIYVPSPLPVRPKVVEVPQILPAASNRRPSHKMTASDGHKNATSQAEGLSADNHATYRFPNRPARSKSEPTQWDRNQDGSQRRSRRQTLTRTPVPPLPSDIFASLSSEVMAATRDLTPVAGPGMSKQTGQRVRQARAATAPSSPHLDQSESPKISQTRRPSDTAHNTRGPLSVVKDLFSPPRKASLEEKKAPATPIFQKAVRSGSVSDKTASPTAAEAGDKEARFLELLCKSDSSAEGIIKISLTARAARDSFAVVV